MELPGDLDSKESACSADETQIQSLGQEDSLEKGMTQCSCLENSLDRGALWATVCGIAKRWTQWSDYHFQKVVDTSFSKFYFFFKTST